MNNARDNFYMAALLHELRRYHPLAPTGSVDIAALYSQCLQSVQLPNAEDIIVQAVKLSVGVSELPDSQTVSYDRLIPILDTIQRPEDYTQWNYFPVSKVQLTPCPFLSEKNSSQQEYQDLWGHFYSELGLVSTADPIVFSETLLSLLLKYASQIPSPYPGQSDVSLFDHIKSTAAIAVCLYDNTLDGITDDNAFQLIGADFSGIQPYIYQIVSKYASKNLKGRSFYLRLLSDAVVRFLLKELNLFSANIVYNSGGSFYLLSANTPQATQRLNAAVQTIEQHLFAHHRTALFVSIDSVKLSSSDLLHNSAHFLGDTWGELFVKRDSKKAAKFSNQILSNYSTFFQPTQIAGDVKCDTITGEEFLEGEKQYTLKDMELKESSYLQIQLGSTLRTTSFIIVANGVAIPQLDTKLHIQPCQLGITYYFLSSADDLSLVQASLQPLRRNISQVTMNGFKGNCDFLNIPQCDQNIRQLEFYGGNETDLKNPRTFEQMCQSEGDLSRMGVLRMDVDNLGSIFQSGIPRGKASLARFSALSRSFDLFFSGYLNAIWRQTSPDKTFVIYSGGDDIFIVGNWSDTILLAEQVHIAFNDFACHNPVFSLSGGVAILLPKYPIMKGAEESAQEEESAKSHQCAGQVKNSLSFMDMPLNWQHEFPAVKSLKDTLLHFLKNKQLSKSFVSKVLSVHSNANYHQHQIQNFSTYWVLTYDLTRLKNRNKTVSTIIDNCINDVCNHQKSTLNGFPVQSHYHPLELWAFASRWAELENRT